MIDTEVTSPESVVFTYDLAGLGSRFAALLVDVTIQLLLVALALIVASGSVYLDVMIYSPRHAREMGLSLWMWAAFIIVNFLILWGYFVFFEMIWNGQSPGKRLFGLRVIRVGGYPVDLAASAIRNLIRYVDFIPGTYSVGALTMFLSRQWQRLGDYAAGTLVVRDRRLRAPAEYITETGPSWEESLAQVDRVTAEEYAVVREFLRRRGDLERNSRADLARRIADPLAAKLVASLGAGPEAREQFLEALAAAYRQRFG